MSDYIEKTTKQAVEDLEAAANQAIDDLDRRAGQVIADLKARAEALAAVERALERTPGFGEVGGGAVAGRP